MDKFDFKKRLGVGHFGEVWLVHDIALNIDCALKCIPNEKVINRANFFEEAQLLQAAQHPNIVEIRDAGVLPDPDGRVYVSMEFYKKGSLEDEASGGYIPLSRARKLMIDTLRGLEHSHAKDIIHRDIKPGNILIGPNLEGKLSDFGLALSKKGKTGAASFKDYIYELHMAPEIISGADYSFLTDIYACGVTLYRLVNGDTFLKGSLTDDLTNKILSGAFPDRDAYRWFIPRKIRAVINKAMHIDPSKRYAAAVEMRRALEQIDIHMNWFEHRFPSSIKWSGSLVGSSQTCVVEMKKVESKYNVVFEKGKSKHELRKVHKFCKEGLTYRDAELWTKNILQGVVDGRIKI